ncbi:hypothetical protein DERP_010443 [Dermatophagoides pteronyssinus]|uniref:Uncharacterized protein n=1 Tax=Dermatophagoides pteronyssinus TaxID=6956 RepID=A0ABQ8J4X5_DERPT|nr:hypothetical protein DERP_010443 [Dermatophagoides pteronyssinus]
MDAKKILHSYLILEYLVLILYNMIDWILFVLKSKQYRLGSSQNYNLERNFSFNHRIAERQFGQQQQQQKFIILIRYICVLLDSLFFIWFPHE